jgi:pimeloyl-CoA synthetase
VSLVPLETARAFESPMLIKKDGMSNTAVDELVEEMGGKEVRYGVVLADAKTGHRLEMANPSVIKRPRRWMRLDG